MTVEPGKLFALPLEYIRQETVLRKVCEAVRAGEYVAILGPRFSGKSLLIKDVLNTLQEEGDFLPVYISFEEWRIYETKQFFGRIADVIRSAYIKQGLHPPDGLHSPDIKDGQGLRLMLSELMKAFPTFTCILALNHIEALPRYLARALLRCLRVAYSERDIHSEYQQVVTIAAGALNLYKLSEKTSVSQTSPFNVARLISIPDASEELSRQLIERFARQAGVHFSSTAIQRILDVTKGDLYLIEFLCHLAVEQFNRPSSQGPKLPRRVTFRGIDHAIDSLKTCSEILDPGLRERVRSVEANPYILKTVLEIIGGADRSGKEVRRRDLPTDIDEVELTGLVRFENNRYVIRNPLCEIILRCYFKPLNAARMFAIFGRWEDAVECFETIDLFPNLAERGEYLNAVVNLVNVLDDEEQALQKVCHALERGFRVRWMNLYRLDEGNSRGEDELSRLPKLLPMTSSGVPGFERNNRVLPDPIILQDRSEQIEARAFLSGDFLLEEDQLGVSLLAFTIDPKVGLVTIYDYFPVGAFVDHQREVLDIAGFLGQVGRAIAKMKEREGLLMRERQRVDLMSGLNEVTKAITGVLDLDDLLRLVVEKILEVMQADVVSIYLFDAEQQEFYKPIAVGNIDEQFPQHALPKVTGEIAGEIINMGKYVIIDEKTILAQPIIHNENIVSAAGFPLLSIDNPLGILFVNYRRNHQFSDYECQTILAFADQAAIAIQNARLYEEKSHQKDLMDIRARQLSAISQVAMEMRSQDEPDTVLRLALTGVTCGEGLGFSRAILFLVDEDSKMLLGKAAIGALTEAEAHKNWENSKGLSLETSLKAVRGWPKGPRGELDRKVQQMSLPLQREQGAPAMCVLERTTIFVQDAHHDPHTNQVITDQLGSDSFAALPLVAKERPIGVLIVDQKFLPLPIAEGDLHMVETLADLAAIAVENAVLVKKLEGFGDIAHQLRSPLTDIRGYVQLLMDGIVKDPVKVQEYYQIVLAAVEGFESSVNYMLSLKKIEAGLYDIRMREASFTKIIRGVIQLYRYNAALKHIEIFEELNHQDDTVWADSEKLASAIQVLLENAIKFSFEGSQVRIITGDDPEGVWVSVIDHGRGIPDSERAHLGERYFRGKIAREEQIDGAGLGLMIAKYIVEGHHGRLSVESKLNKGSTFTIVLPRSGGD